MKNPYESAWDVQYCFNEMILIRFEYKQSAYMNYCSGEPTLEETYEDSYLSNVDVVSYAMILTGCNAMDWTVHRCNYRVKCSYQ